MHTTLIEVFAFIGAIFTLAISINVLVVMAMLLWQELDRMERKIAIRKWRKATNTEIQ